MKIEEVKKSPSLLKHDRVAAHSHITGLGLDAETGMASLDANNNGGMVGQVEAREACGLVADLVRSSKLAGRAILLAGGSGTGKTALALALSHELGSRVPFCPLVGSQVVSTEVKQTEIIMQHIRRSIGLRIREKKEVYEGEVTELTVQESEDPLGGYGRAISHVVLGLKSSKGTKTLRLDPSIHESLTKEKVAVGDIIYIESNSGAVKRVGRSDVYATEFDLEAEDYVPLPKGEVHKKRDVVQDVTMHDLDVANAQPTSGSRDVLSMVQQLNKPKKTEITEKLRLEVNRVVSRYIAEGVAELIPGVLFIDEVHMLDMECFTYLNKSLESTLSPILVMATNRGLTHIRSSGCRQGDDDDLLSPHGIPMDLLDRMLIIRTKSYSKIERYQILSKRAKVEGIDEIDTEALEALAELGGASTSLRFVIQLLTPAKIIATCTDGRNRVTLSDINTVKQLFLHGKMSAKQLSEGGGEGYLQY